MLYLLENYTLMSTVRERELKYLNTLLQHMQWHDHSIFPSSKEQKCDVKQMISVLSTHQCTYLCRVHGRYQNANVSVQPDLGLNVNQKA